MIWYIGPIATAGVASLTLLSALAPGQDPAAPAKKAEATTTIITKTVTVEEKPAAKVEAKGMPFLKVEMKTAEKVEAKPAAEAKAVDKVEVKKQAVVRKQAVAKVAIAVAPVAPGDNGNDAQIDALALQSTPQCRPILRAEFHLADSTCGMAKDQRRRVAAKAEVAFKGAVRKYAEAQNKMMRGGWNANTSQPDPRKIIQEELAKIVKAELPPAQSARYLAEVEKRAANRKEVTVHTLVAKLDQDLVLTADQRDKLTKSLLGNWVDGWAQSVEMLQYGDAYFPSIPDKVISPHLSKTQKKVWDGMPRNGGMIFGMAFANGINVEMGDEPLIEEDAPAAALSRAKKALEGLGAKAAEAIKAAVPARVKPQQKAAVEKAAASPD